MEMLQNDDAVDNGKDDKDGQYEDADKAMDDEDKVDGVQFHFIS